MAASSYSEVVSSVALPLKRDASAPTLQALQLRQHDLSSARDSALPGNASQAQLANENGRGLNLLHRDGVFPKQDCSTLDPIYQN